LRTLTAIGPSRIREIRTAKLRQTQIGSVQVCVAKVSATDIGAVQIRHNMRILFPPTIPNICLVVQDFQVSIIRHFSSYRDQTNHDPPYLGGGKLSRNISRTIPPHKLAKASMGIFLGGLGKRA
jgi:hypothetical protein